MPKTTIGSFAGVNLRDDSTDLPADGQIALRRAEGCLLRPNGALARPPIYDRLWGLLCLKNYAGQLGLTAADKGVCILVRNEGHLLLAFYDFQNLQSLGFVYGGQDPENPPAGPPTFSATGATLTVLWKGLAVQRKWSGGRGQDAVVMGNGSDPNLTWVNSTMTIRPQADQVRPLRPVVSFVDPDDTVFQNASLTANGVTFYALEEFFRPVHDYNPNSQVPYRRDRGNLIKLSVVQSGYTTFSSSLTGFGTVAEPYVYTVLCPETLPTEQQLVNFVLRDPNAQAIVTARLNGAGSSTVRLFPATSMTGGVAEFSPADYWTGPDAAVCITYFKRGLTPGTGTETMPSPISSAQQFTNGRVAVTINADTVSPIAAGYDTIRIYVADVSAKSFGLSVESYTPFLFAMEVPNISGTYVLAPSMVDPTRPVSIEGRVPPPCSMFVFANNQLVMSGNEDFPLRVFYTKVSTRETPFPEGMGIYDFTDYQATIIGDAVVALGSYRGQAVVYTKTKAYPFETGTTARFAIASGAMNSSCVITWTNGAQYYLGRDLVPYTLTQPVTDARSDVPDFNIPFPQIGNYLQQYCDPNDTIYPNGIVDSVNKNWWLFLRGLVGNMQGFCINLEQNQVTGPFDFPQFMASTFFDEGDTRIVGMDLAGNLFWLDFTQPFTLSETFDNSAPITLYDASSAADNTLDGFGLAQISPTQFVKRAQVMRFQSPWMNLNGADRRKAITSVEFQVVQGSAGLVAIAAYNDSDAEPVVRYYGDVFNYRNPHRIRLKIAGNLVQFLMIVIAADDKPFAIRNVTLGYEPMGEP